MVKRGVGVLPSELLLGSPDLIRGVGWERSQRERKGSGLRQRAASLRGRALAQTRPQRWSGENRAALGMRYQKSQFGEFS